MKNAGRTFKALLGGGLVLLFVFAFASQAMGQTWTEITPFDDPAITTDDPPTPRFSHSAVVNPTNKQMIMFGGGPSFTTTGQLGDVWVLSNADGLDGPSAWTQLLPTGVAPSPRLDHTAVYDAVTNRMIVFGGNPSFGFCFGAVNDTWILENADGQGGTPTWTQIVPSGGPPSGRSVHVAGYDPVTNRMVVFGGFNPCVTVFVDVWVLKNANDTAGSQEWVQLSPTGSAPPASTNFRGAYDRANNRLIVMFAVGDLDRVWVLENANGMAGGLEVAPNWTELTPGGTPPLGFGNTSMVYDEANNRAVVFGSLLTSATFVLENANGLGGPPAWSLLEPSGALPTPRDSHSAVYVPDSGRMTIFGGRLCPVFPSDCASLGNDVWTLELPPPPCGDGLLDPDEECDDGNTDDGDGCSSACTVEEGFVCTGEPSVCGPDCNANGIPDECEVASFEYVLDDGTRTSAIGVTGGGDLIWLNQFTVTPGAEITDSVEIAWGPVPANTPTTIVIWDDPNNDGNPSDAAVLATTGPVPVTNPNTNIFTTVPVPPTFVGQAGDSFFIGALITHAGGEFPANLDGTPPSQLRSWIAGGAAGTGNINNLPANGLFGLIDSFGFPGNWLLRARRNQTSEDCNTNGVPDECEPDCNANGTADECDITNMTSADCNLNAVPDECDPDCNRNGTVDDCEVFADCNANGVPDECDIAAGTSEDCNLNGVPDECETITDCNGNLIADECDVARGVSGDCNVNGIPDECESPVCPAKLVVADVNSGGRRSSGAPPPGNVVYGLLASTGQPGGVGVMCTGGPPCDDVGLPTPLYAMANGFQQAVLDNCPAVPNPLQTDVDGDGVGDACDLCPAGNDGIDCNRNGVADGCEIADCNPASVNFPACDDCNGNGSPDECDIAVGLSQDVDLDGVPDECVAWAGPPAGGNFSDPGNFGGTAPGPGNSVTIDAGAGPFTALSAGAQLIVDLDIPATFDSLRLLNGAVLTVVGAVDEDLTLLTAPDGEQGLQIRGDPNVDSRVLVANDRQINVAGSVVIEDAGEYLADPEATSPVSASLTAQRVLIRQGAPCGGKMELTDSMSVSVAGDLVLEGSATPVTCGSSAASLLGGRTPPVLRIVSALAAGSGASDGSSGSGGLLDPRIDIGGNFLMTLASETKNDSDEGVFLAGNFDNQATFPSLFDWSDGRLTLNGTNLQRFEVAGVDLGPLRAAFDDNFAMGTIEVSPASKVRLVNTFGNTAAGTGPCAEALYVDELILQPGSVITLDNVRVFYNRLQDNGAVINLIGPCSELVSVCAADPAGLPQPERLATLPGQPISTKNRFLSFSAVDVGRSQAVRVTFVSLPPPLFNSWDGFTLWAGAPKEVSENSGCVDPACAPGAPTFHAATLQCSGPVFLDWNVLGVVHLFHEGIVPGGLYQIQMIDESCNPASEAGFSGPLELIQAKWGDVVENCASIPCPPPDGINNILDVLANVDKFVNAPTAIIKARAELVNTDANIGGCVDLNTNIIEVLRTVDALLGLSYPFAPSTPDPCASTCPNPLP